MSGCISCKVVVTIMEIRGKCEAGHKVGDQIEFIGDNVMKGKVKCVYGMNAIFPLLHTIAYGGKIPTSSPLCVGENTFVGCCPDPNNCVVYELKVGEAYWRTPKSEYTKETHSFVPMPKKYLASEEE
jgi:uncharacterized repeat protein (TIGR04076 family)